MSRLPLIQRLLADLGIAPPVLDVPAQGAVFDDVTVVDPGSGRMSSQRLTIAGSRIEDISPTGSEKQDPQGNRRYAGRFLLPGLIDMHVHYPILPSPWVPSTFDMSVIFGPLFLAHGVTTVRDVGNFHATIWNVRARMNGAEFPAPRMFCCGPILDGEDGKMGDLSKILATPDQAIHFMDDLARRKPDFIKVYDWLNPETMKTLREEAKMQHLPIVGHIPFRMRFEDAGVEDVQHLNGLQFEDPYPGFNFHNPEHFAMYYKRWAEVSDDRIDKIVRISVDQNVAHTPTIVTQDRIARMKDPNGDDYPVQYLMPRYVRDVCWDPAFGLQYLQGHADEVFDIMKWAVERIKAVVTRLKEEGVRVFAGTDGPYNPYTAPGVSLYEELSHLVECGFTPEEAWMAASRHPGEFLGMPLLGTLKKGAPADILVYREDPTRDLAALSTLEAVIVDGRLYTKEALDDGMKKHREYFEGRLFDSVIMAIARREMKNLE